MTFGVNLLEGVPLLLVGRETGEGDTAPELDHAILFVGALRQLVLRDHPQSQRVGVERPLAFHHRVSLDHVTILHLEPPNSKKFDHLESEIR